MTPTEEQDARYVGRFTRERGAAHNAAHAVACVRLGIEFAEVRLLGPGEPLGLVSPGRGPMDDVLVMMLCGHMASIALLPHSIPGLPQELGLSASAVVRLAHRFRDAFYFDMLTTRASDLVQRNIDAISQVKIALLNSDRASYGLVQVLCSSWPAS